MWKDRVEHAKDIWAIYPGQTAHLTVRCMNALYRLQVMRGEAMSHLMALLEATKITLDNIEELVVDLSTEMVDKDLQVEQLSNEIQEQYAVQLFEEHRVPSCRVRMTMEPHPLQPAGVRWTPSLSDTRLRTRLKQLLCTG